jgi:hypothetical protein
MGGSTVGIQDMLSPACVEGQEIPEVIRFVIGVGDAGLDGCTALLEDGVCRRRLKVYIIPFRLVGGSAGIKAHTC